MSASRVFARVEAWFFAPQPIDAMVLARILLGSALASSYAIRFREVQAVWGPEGFAGPAWFTDLYRRPAAVQQVLDALSPGTPPSELLIWALYAGVVLASLAFALGFRTRTAGVLALLIHMYLQRGRMPLAYWGWAVQIQPLFFYVVCSRAGRFASVDAWLARRRNPSPGAANDWVGPAWPMRLLMIHTTLMYLTSGGERLDDAGWLHGQSVWIALSNSIYSKVGFDWTPYKTVLHVSTLGTYVLEATAPILLWVPRIGVVVVYLSLAMHAGLEALTLVGYWNFCMVAGLLCFLPVSHLRVLTRRFPMGPREAETS